MQPEADRAEEARQGCKSAAIPVYFAPPQNPLQAEAAWSCCHALCMAHQRHAGRQRLVLDATW